jgi:hypothetical protein
MTFVEDDLHIADAGSIQSACILWVGSFSRSVGERWDDYCVTRRLAPLLRHAYEELLTFNVHIVQRSGLLNDEDVQNYALYPINSYSQA